MKNSESPFHRHRKILLHHDYSGAQTLQSFALSCWNGNTWQFRGDRLTSLDQKHLTIFLELAQQYSRHGENDPVFMEVCREMIEKRRRWAAENKSKIDELAASSPEDYPDGRTAYWQEMDERGQQHTLNQKRYLIE